MRRTSDFIDYCFERGARNGGAKTAMTRSMFRNRLCIVYGVIVVLLTLGGGLSWCLSTKALPFLALSPVVVAVPAVYLANCFQKRAMFVSSLRALWSDAVYAKGLLVQYCLSKGGTDYYEAWMRQSNIIDEVRAVFRNIGETRHMVGSRPFAPLLDMLNEFEKLDPSPWQLSYTRPRYFGRSQKNITDSLESVPRRLS